jgi:hypothetical protein
VLRQRRTCRSPRCCSSISSEASVGRLRYLISIDHVLRDRRLVEPYAELEKRVVYARGSQQGWRGSYGESAHLPIGGLRDLEPTARANGMPLNQGRAVDQTKRGATAAGARSVQAVDRSGLSSAELSPLKELAADRRRPHFQVPSVPDRETDNYDQKGEACRPAISFGSQTSSVLWRSEF